MDEITIILQVTNKKHSDIYKYLIDQSTGHVQRSTYLRVFAFILSFCSKMVKFIQYEKSTLAHLCVQL